jgi:hypothetical protein
MILRKSSDVLRIIEVSLAGEGEFADGLAFESFVEA